MDNFCSEKKSATKRACDGIRQGKTDSPLRRKSRSQWMEPRRIGSIFWPNYATEMCTSLSIKCRLTRAQFTCQQPRKMNCSHCKRTKQGEQLTVKFIKMSFHGRHVPTGGSQWKRRLYEPFNRPIMYRQWRIQWGLSTGRQWPCQSVHSLSDLNGAQWMATRGGRNCSHLASDKSQD